MRENSRVPPSRHSPDDADRPGDQVPAASPAPDEPSPETAGPATTGQAGPDESAGLPRRVRGGNKQAGPDESAGLPRRVRGGNKQAGPDESAGLPRRVRGDNGLRPPIRVERPTFSDSMLEKLRAAVAAEVNGEPEDPAPPREPAEHVDLFGAAGPAEATSEAAAETGQETAEPPVRPLGAQGARKPIETFASSSPLKEDPELPGAVGDTTQPIPVIARGLSRKGSGIRASSQPETEKEKAAPAAPETPAAHRPPARSVVQAKRPAKPKAARKAKSGPRKTGTGRAYRVAGLLAVVLIAMGTGAFLFVHYSHRPVASAAISSADLPLTTRNSAAAWVAGQVAAGDKVACDPVMCRALEKDGVASARLRVLWPAGADSLAGVTVVVATPAVQSHLGARLDAVEAPGIIASFGSGRRQIVIRVMAPHGAAAYKSALAADLSERKSSGQVLSSSSIRWSPAERRQLAAGQVDVRLMVAIADLAASHPVQVVAFGDGGPGAPWAPLRSAELAYSSTAAKNALLDGLATIAIGGPEYQALHTTTVRLRTGQTVLLVEFSAPSPLGLLDGGS
jgi:hypothetical protein